MEILYFTPSPYKNHASTSPSSAQKSGLPIHNKSGQTPDAKGQADNSKTLYIKGLTGVLSQLAVMRPMLQLCPQIVQHQLTSLHSWI